MFFVFLFSTINSVKVISVNLDNFMQCAFNTLFRLIFNVVVFIVSLSPGCKLKGIMHWVGINNKSAS